MEPQRMCLACRGRDPQSALVRLVWAAGVVTTDPERRLPGRGAWVHPGCAAVLSARRGVVGRALRVSVDPAQVSQVLASVGGDSANGP